MNLPNLEAGERPLAFSEVTGAMLDTSRPSGTPVVVGGSCSVTGQQRTSPVHVGSTVIAKQDIWISDEANGKERNMRFRGVDVPRRLRCPWRVRAFRALRTVGPTYVLLVASAIWLLGCAVPSTAPSPDPAAVQPAPELPADLPEDADRSDVARQLALLQRGLYLTTTGEVRALPAKYARASWSADTKAPPTEKAAPQTDERIHIRLEERPRQ